MTAFHVGTGTIQWLVTGYMLIILELNFLDVCSIPSSCTYFCFYFIKNTTKITRPHIDYLSIIESAIGFASLVASVSLASDLGLTSPLIIGLFVWAIVVLVFYVHRQLNLKNPVLNLKIFSITQFRTGALLVMVDFEIILSTMYLLPQFIQKIFHWQ